MSDSSIDTIRHALTVAREYGFAEVEFEAAETSFHATLSPAPLIGTPPPAVGEPDELPDISMGEINATLVGYYQPAEPALAVGQRVSKGEIVAIIAALGLANDIESPVAGEVVKILAKPGQSVEYGQVLAEVRLTQ